MDSKFPPDVFGDMIMILEFLYVFGEFFGIKEDFPDGITLGKYNILYVRISFILKLFTV